MKIPPPPAAAIIAAGFQPRLEEGRKHARVHIESDDRSRFITISKSASDHRAVQNMIRDARHVMRELGA